MFFSCSKPKMVNPGIQKEMENCLLELLKAFQVLKAMRRPSKELALLEENDNLVFLKRYELRKMGRQINKVKDIFIKMEENYFDALKHPKNEDHQIVYETILRFLKEAMKQYKAEHVSHKKKKPQLPIAQETDKMRSSALRPKLR